MSARESPLSVQDHESIGRVTEHVRRIFALSDDQMEPARLCVEMAFTLGKMSGATDEHERAIAAIEAIRAGVAGR